jgi:hypothetical protein
VSRNVPVMRFPQPEITGQDSRRCLPFDLTRSRVNPNKKCDRSGKMPMIPSAGYHRKFWMTRYENANPLSN